MTTLILDNYDSFTFNLYQLIGELEGKAPLVFRNDELTLDDVRRLSPERIVLSPGPGRPEVPRDFGVCGSVITDLDPNLPILGVCLGHQGIIHFLGGRVVRAPEILHGKTSEAHLEPGARLFLGLAPSIEVMRYHSLIGERASLPPSLVVTARTSDGLVMAVEHQTRPLFGIQFHPESVGTPDGRSILANFLAVPRGLA